MKKISLDDIKIYKERFLIGAKRTVFGAGQKLSAFWKKLSDTKNKILKSSGKNADRHPEKKKRRMRRIIKIKPADVFVLMFSLIFSALVIVPSIYLCEENRAKKLSERHMNDMITTLSKALTSEMETGGTRLNDIIVCGNYQKLITELTALMEDGKNFPPSDFYMRSDGTRLYLASYRYSDISDKEINFPVLVNTQINTPENITPGAAVAYLHMSGDGRGEADAVQTETPKSGEELLPSAGETPGESENGDLDDIRVIAVYVGGYTEELTDNKYTVFSQQPDTSHPEDGKIYAKYNKTSIWDNSRYSISPSS